MAKVVFRIEDDVLITSVVERAKEVFCRYYTASAALSSSPVTRACGELLPADEYGNSAIAYAECWIGTVLERAYGGTYVGNRKLNNMVVYSQLHESLLHEEEDLFQYVRVPYGFTLDFEVFIMDNQTVLFQGKDNDYFTDAAQSGRRITECYLRTDRAV